jgi:hypothetical protein
MDPLARYATNAPRRCAICGIALRDEPLQPHSQIVPVLEEVDPFVRVADGAWIGLAEAVIDQLAAVPRLDLLRLRRRFSVDPDGRG